MTISPNGTYTPADSNVWTFVPEFNATAWQQDQEIMSFGWWLQEPNSANGTYTFRYYADGTDYVPTTPNGTLAAGTATYNGRAAGKYVVQDIGDGGVTGGTASIFTAAATLNATFGTAANTISGTVSSFQGEDGSMPGWEVTLGRKALGAETALGNPFAAATQPDPSAPNFNGVTANSCRT